MVTIQLKGLRLSSVVGHMGVVNDQPRGLDTRTIDYSSPQGARSTSTLAGDRVGLSVAGPVDVGTRGQWRVIDSVLAALRKAGFAVAEEAGRDDRGEDHILRIDSERVVLQIVSVPSDGEFWRAVANGAASADVALSRAVEWIDEAIRGKAKYDKDLKRSMLLAIDLAHAGVLATARCVGAYVDRYGDPERHGFAATWLIGPTPQLCARLGSGRW